MINISTLIVLILLVTATGLAWLIRANRLLLITLLLLGPLPASFVMVYWAERFSSDPPDSDYVRYGLAMSVCYMIVWFSLFAGWLSSKLSNGWPKRERGNS